jgi:intracellular septation protein
MNQIIKLLIELGPLVVFFYANSHFSDENGVGGLIPATQVFMVAMAISMVASKILLKKVALMLWISAGLVAIFGGLSIYFESEIFIKIKPTILYSLFAITLLGGCFFGKPFLKNLMEAGMPPIEEIAWMKMSRNWGLFFIGCAILNEILWRNLSNADWISAKIWVFMPLSFIFAFAQMPIVLKHQIEEDAED